MAPRHNLVKVTETRVRVVKPYSLRHSFYPIERLRCQSTTYEARCDLCDWTATRVSDWVEVAAATETDAYHRRVEQRRPARKLIRQDARAHNKFHRGLEDAEGARSTPQIGFATVVGRGRS